MMRFKSFEIEGPVLVTGSVHTDARGTFSEAWRADAFHDNGINIDWVQDNVSVSRVTGTVRGLHWQIPPFAQAKLVRPLSGRITDVAVDLRHGSPSFGQAVVVELDSARNEQLYVPVGFAHGFCTRAPDTIVTYKVSHIYAPQAERSVFWADPALPISWPVDPAQAVLTEKDLKAPRLAQLSAGDLF